CKQNGVQLGDVVLPPWAKGGPKGVSSAYTDRHWSADYVSQHLHEWIDLIFGHKQQGPAAVDSVNLFHHLFYEGNVDIYRGDCSTTNLDNLKPSLQPIKELKGPVGQILQFEKTVQAVEQNKVLVPPTWSRYVAWGFADHSLRIGSYDSDKAAMVCEEVMQGSGEVVACVCPSSKIIVTAGTSSVSTSYKRCVVLLKFSSPQVIQAIIHICLQFPT
ncbi:WD repeat and FYVE domain-containing protein 3-like, partial [Homalodisca vitripennis]|uniref:WD repeat and FYVE domain-containing protein 3-like n=1 Tax=Homalodisca vitripennis TaxID=197043 RepID=UPI001EEB824F